MRRFWTVLGAACVLAGANVVPALAATSYYRVVSASATAVLTYSGGSANSRTSGRAEVKISRKPTRAKPRGEGFLGPAGGSVAFAISARETERATLSARAGPTSPYVEQQCRGSRKRRASGGLRFRRVAGGRVEARWAFPHARPRTCPGPRVSIPSRRMMSLLRRGRFPARTLTITLAGSARFVSGSYRGLYRWRATVTLRRL